MGVVNPNYRWNDWNLEKIVKHLRDMTPEEVESIFSNLAMGYPRKSRGAYVVRGKSNRDRWLQVAYVTDDDGAFFVIHTRPLTDKERRKIE
ncbi:MAG: hypothetical protein A3G34_00905 [Candidatus Lindowbacteria bacterium RIFCSPLOWO2_12_FULL_62_27]|nr:MAG: hypothetical protein A3G34_00905 [Candidatus Lindowbacteria bacterium RIFCSPLOWO2_12_FULL_62_27]